MLSDRILAAARTSFASVGYAATSLRSVARDAEVDPALVSYYFASKDKLLDSALMPPPGFLDAIAAAAGGPLRTRGAALVGAMLAIWDDPTSAAVIRAIILTAAHEPVAMDRLRSLFGEQMLGAVADNLTGDERVLRASLVGSQIVGVAMTRYVWRVGALATMTSSDVARLVAPSVQRYLTGKPLA